jgi:hypothetical protein
MASLSERIYPSVVACLNQVTGTWVNLADRRASVIFAPLVQRADEGYSTRLQYCCGVVRVVESQSGWEECRCPSSVDCGEHLEVAHGSVACARHVCSSRSTSSDGVVRGELPVDGNGRLR